MSRFFIKLVTEYFRWVVLAVVVIILGVGYGLFLNPQVVKIQTTSFSERTHSKNELKSDQRYLDSLNASLTKFSKAYNSDDIEKLDRFLPDQTEFPEILLTLQNMASSVGLSMDSITISKMTDNATETDTAKSSTDTAETTTNPGMSYQQIPGVSAQDITVTFNGGQGYDHLKKFLAVIESSERLFDVISLSFSQPSSSSQNGAPYSMVLRTYAIQSSTSKE